MDEKMTATISTIRVEIESVIKGPYLPMIVTTEGKKYYVAESVEKAGEAARRYWSDMMNNAPDEFIETVGADNVITLAKGEPADLGIGRLGEVESLADFLNLVEMFTMYTWASPPRHWWCFIANPSPALVEKLGFEYTPKQWRGYIIK